MSYHLTTATFKVEGYHEEKLSSKQQREVLQSLLWLVCFSSTGISDLSERPHNTWVYFHDVIQVQAVLKRKEEEDQQMQQLIQALQASLEKEKSKVKDLKKQVMAHLLVYLLKR